MARKHPKPPAEIQNDSDDDAPEAVSHSVSKADVKRTEKALREFEAGEKARRKDRNRQRDRKLKERAVVTRVLGGSGSGDGVTGKAVDKVSSKGKAAVEGKTKVIQVVPEEDSEGSDDEQGEGVDELDSALEARMRRAMEDAAGEIGGDDEEMGSGAEEEHEDGEADGDDDDEDEDDEGVDEDELMDSDNGASDPEASSDEFTDFSHPVAPSKRPKSNPSPKYLQEDLFTAAFASQSQPAQKTAPSAAKPPLPKKRRPRSQPHVKDMVIGSRTIRTLPNLSDPKARATAKTLPSRHVRKFLERTLVLKGAAKSNRRHPASTTGWERRPANVGVMRVDGAPVGFVRGTR
ncbi:hypothetical protein BV22DRAFT_1135384 [Leucogyrophana mollusca]|uniref:Uncharacterized protein n=1 Tax=Leucogyrophana mollusca TaxID=85980 RepID=A0ACB8AX67_9AGAM|nr:hypothetical protein BV22DRAFT_1135384 [Leucogyrophana mollusca]